MAQKYLDMNGLTRYHEGLLDYMSEAVGTQGDMSVTDPTNMAYIKNVPDWVRSETKPEYDAAEVGADATGTAHTEVSNHDVSETAHEDIRNLIQEINTQIEESTWDDKYTKEEVDGKDATTLADAKAYNDAAYANANAYTDQKIADLINGAPTTLDTLGEIATAMAENADVVEALDEAIGKKADQTELDTHTGNNTIHITADERTAWNNKANASDLANYLSKSGGGIVSKNGTKVMGIHNTNSVYTLFEFYGNGSELGSLGFDGVNNPMYRGADGTTGSLLHTGNIGDYALPKSGGTLSGNLKFSSALPENASPTVVATFGSNNSANGFSYTSTSKLSVNYATSAGSADTVDGYHASNLVSFEHSPSSIGSNSPASGAKTYWSNSALNQKITAVYNNAGTEYSLLFSKSGSYGNILSWTYNDTYLRILRHSNGNWQTTDWEKISAGYADSAGTAGSISNQGSAATKDIVMTTSDPGAGAASSYKEGSIICVYE